MSSPLRITELVKKGEFSQAIEEAKRKGDNVTANCVEAVRQLNAVIVSRENPADRNDPDWKRRSIGCLTNAEKLVKLAKEALRRH